MASFAGQGWEQAASVHVTQEKMKVKRDEKHFLAKKITVVNSADLD